MAGAAASCCFALISRSSSRTEGRSSGGLTVPSAVLFCFFEIGADGWDFSAAFPKEAFLLTSAGMGSLNKLLNVYKREDLLDFGDGKRIKKMKIAIWNINTNSPDASTMVPKI